MGIWLKEVRNSTSQILELFYGDYRSPRKAKVPREFNRSLGPEMILPMSIVTGRQSNAFGITMSIGGRPTHFSIWDIDWKLHILGDGHAGYENLSITRNFGEYKNIVNDIGITIEDISQMKWALAANGVSKRYYHLFMRDGVMFVEPSFHIRPEDRK